MNTLFDIISRYFWLLALFMGGVNYARARRAIQRHGQVEEDTLACLGRVMFIADLPWMLMGVGQISGYTPTIFYYFLPADGNPFVLAWFGLIFFITSGYTWWVLFAGGAERVKELSSYLASNQIVSTTGSLRAIKIVAAFAPLFVVSWIYFVETMKAPLP